MTRDAAALWALPLYAMALAAPFSVGGGNLAAGLILAAAALRLGTAAGRAALPPRSLLWALGAYLAVNAAATLFASPYPSHWGKWLEEMWLKLLLVTVPVLAGTAPQHLRRVVRILVLAGALVAIYAIVQHFTGLELRHGKALEPIGGTYFALGFFSHHLSYGGQVLVLWIFAAAWALDRGLARRRPFSWPLAAFVLLSCALLWSYARSAQVGAVAGAIVLVLLQQGRKRRWAVTVLGVVLVAAAIVPSTRMRFAHFFEAGAEQTRLNLWRSAIDGIAARPLLGYGPGNFRHLMEQHAYPGVYEAKGHAHDDFLMHACNAGLLGLIAALVLLVLVTVLLCRASRRIAPGSWVLLGGVALQFAISVAGLFQVYQTDDEVEMVLYFLLGCGLGLMGRPPRVGAGEPAG